MPALEDYSIFDFSRDDEDDGAEADMNNLDITIQVSLIPITRIHKDHPLDQVIGDLQSATQTRKMSKNLKEHGKNQKGNLCIEGSKLDRGYAGRAVYKNKKDERGIMIRNKADWLLKEVHTRRRISYDEVFAPVPRIKAIRLFLAYASFKDFEVYQMDVKSDFLYRKIEEEVYVCQPPGFEDLDFPDILYKVEKALYGLHQAPKAWYETLLTYLLDNGFQRGKIDKTLFIKRHKGDILLVQVYVDDIIFGSTKKELCNAFEKLMHEKFQMSSMGELTFFLGLQVQFIEVTTASTPMETQKPLLKDEDGEEVDVHMYRYQVNPKVSHLYAVKRIFRYLKGQPKLGLWYPKDSPFDLVAYTDSDYAGASLDRKSTIGGKAKKIVKLMMEKLFGMELELMLFWSTVKAKTVNEEKVLIIYQILPSLNNLHLWGSKTTAWNEFSSTMASAIICLTTNQKFNFSKYIFESMIRNLDNLSGKFLMYLRKPKRKDTRIPQSSDPSDNVADEAVHNELGDSLVSAATTASSLEAEQDSSNITKTRSKATPNKSSSLGTTSGGGPRRQETIRDTIAQTRFENVSKHSNDLLLSKGNTLRSDEDRLKLKELMKRCTNLQNRVLDLEKTKTTQANVIASLKRRVKKLEQKKRSRTHGLKILYKVGLKARVESSGDEESLGEDASKQGRINAIDADDDITLVSVQNVDEEMFDVDALDGEEVFVAGQNENVVEEVVDAGQPGESTTTKSTPTISSQQSHDKGKGIMIEEPVKPINKKDLIRLDEEVALKLQAEFDEEERLAREKAKKEKEAIIALIETWDDIQAKIDADHQLAERF
ncbi:putative ribonuclease H-like domain-containing protein [Tanacetum coccineum]